MTFISITDRVISPQTVDDSGNLLLHCPQKDADSKTAELAFECLITRKKN